MPELETTPIKVQIRNLHKSYTAEHMVLKGIDLDIHEGEVVCLMGPSGSGKSTLLRCINLLEEADSGVVIVDDMLMGKELRNGRIHELKPKERRKQQSRLGMIFQSFNLFPHLSALENVAEAPQHVLGLTKVEADKKARELIQKVGLGEKTESFPRQLSGGQQQRIAIARALAMEPELLLCDEPTSALDPQLVGEVLKVLRDLAQSGMTMLVVTHEVAFARNVADRIVFMTDGVIVEEGSPAQVIDSPKDPRTREFFGHQTDNYTI